MTFNGATRAATGLVSVGFLFAALGGAQAQDAAKGKSTFNQCKACHALDHALVGPPLGGVIGRKAGTVAGYSYSPLMKAAGDAGLTWDDATLVEYLAGPTDYLTKYLKDKGKTASGQSKMVFKLAAEDARKNVVAYLKDAK